MGLKSNIKNQKWDSKRRRLKYHLKLKNINYLPRLIVFRSNNNIFTQLVDDKNNKTILSVSSIDKEIKGAIDKAKSNEFDNFSLKVDLNRKVRNMIKVATVAA